MYLLGNIKPILKATLLIVLSVSGNFLAETLGCRTRQALENIYVKHLLLLFMIYFTIDFSACETSKWDCAVAFASNHYYQFGFELLLINGLLTFLGLILIRSKQN